MFKFEIRETLTLNKNVGGVNCNGYRIQGSSYVYSCRQFFYLLEYVLQNPFIWLVE